MAKFPSGLFIGPLRLFSGSGSGSKRIFGTYCSQSTFVFEVQPYRFNFNSAKVGAFFALSGPFGTIFGVRVRIKKFSGPTYID